MRRSLSAIAIFVLLSACDGTQQAQDPASASTTASTIAPATTTAPATSSTTSFEPAISADDFAAQVKVLSSDAFGGREPGTAGGKRTVAYLIERFKSMGLAPGNHGKWVQTVPAVSTEMTNTDVKLHIDTGEDSLEFSFPNEFVAVTLQQKPEITLEDSEIVFVGYGVDAPEHDWNDFRGMDLEGKTLIMLVNDPGWGNQNPELFRGRAMTYYGRWTYKYEEAARQGAAAAFVVHETEGAGYPWTVVENGWSGPQYALPLEAGSAPTLPVAGWITTDTARALFAAAGKDFDKLKAAADYREFESVPLGATASITLHNSIERTESSNVLALRKGSARPDEVIVYTAHWDHLGTDPKLEGDPIYNGAIDNATGVAAILEIAGKFAANQPQRSVLFAAVTLEESGLLGAEYYVAHPAFPLDETVANINIDALLIMGPAHDMVVIGYGNSELDDYLKRAVASQDRHLSPNPNPEAGGYYRSDHFNFAKAGVPALYAHGGTDLLEGGMQAGDAAEADYTEHRYHQPADEFDPNWDLGGVMQDIKALYAVGAELANTTSFPEWSETSAFRAKRQKMMQSAKN